MTVIVSQNGSKGIVKESSGFKDEKELEEYIILNPECIPVGEIGRNGKIAVLARQFIVDNNRFDILATDENGEIYIIETKLYKNQDKRKVASQVLDYGTALWNKYRHHEDFERFRSTIEEKIPAKLPEHIKDNFDVNDPEETIAKLRDNLSEGNFIFFVVMDEINDDLKNQIQFLNMKTDSTFAIYAVKMEQYLHDGYTIMVPKLFGFEAKEATSKYDISRSSGSRRQLDEASFFEEAEGKLNAEQVQALRKLYDFSKKTADRIEWGSSFIAYFEKIDPTKSFYYVGTDGKFTFNSHMLHEIPKALRYCDRLKENLSKIRGITILDSYPKTSPRFAVEEWSPVVDDLIAAVNDSIQ